MGRREAGTEKEEGPLNLQAVPTRPFPPSPPPPSKPTGSKTRGTALNVESPSLNDSLTFHSGFYWILIRREVCSYGVYHLALGLTVAFCIRRY